MNSRWDEAPDCDGGEVFSLASLFPHTRVPPIHIFSISAGKNSYDPT
jgi:hypothetical protein